MIRQRGTGFDAIIDASALRRMTAAQKNVQLRATLLGAIPVIIWGGALPIMRAFQSRIGLPRTLGAVFAGAGLLSVIHRVLRRTPFPGSAVFANPYLYGRWVFFVVHEASVTIAVSIVHRENVPLVILINYLWPTLTIGASVLFAGVRVTKPLAVVGGSCVVIASLAFEVLDGQMDSLDVFRSPDTLGYCIAFQGALSWALYSALTRRAGKESGGGLVIPLFQLTLALALPLSFIPGLNVYSSFSSVDAVLLALYCFLQFLAYLFWDRSMRLGNVIVISLFADFIPWLSLLAAHILLHINMGVTTVFSAITLVLGAITTRYGTMLRPSDAEE